MELTLRGMVCQEALAGGCALRASDSCRRLQQLAGGVFQGTRGAKEVVPNNSPGALQSGRQVPSQRISWSFFNSGHFMRDENLDPLGHVDEDSKYLPRKLQGGQQRLIFMFACNPTVTKDFLAIGGKKKTCF